MSDNQHDKLKLELRRGAIVLATLAQLQKEQYGYSLRQNLSAGGLEVDEGTLYPLIRRLEQQGLLTSQWRTEDKRRKRFYQISDTGRSMLTSLTKDWRALSQALETLLEKH